MTRHTIERLPVDPPAKCTGKLRPETLKESGVRRRGGAHCSATAQFSIDGAEFCQAHAARRVLQLALDEWPPR